MSELENNLQDGFTKDVLDKYACLTGKEVEVVDRLVEDVKKTGDVKIASIYPNEEDLPAEVSLTVVAPDWAGLVEAVAGLIHAKGYNIKYLNAFVKDKHYGVVHLRVTADSRERLHHIRKSINDIMEALEHVASGSGSVKRVLQIGFFRMTSMLRISEELRKIVHSDEEFHEITKPEGELEKFILSRTDAYIRDRSPELIARQVYQNFKFIRTLRRRGRGLFVDIHNEETVHGVQTCITVAGFERHISMDDVLDEIREYIPMFKIKYDKQFVTADGIIVIRVEITDRNDNPLSDAKIELLKNRLEDWLSKRKRQRFVISNVIELVGRVLVPRLLQEAQVTGVPQFYMLPEDISNDYADFMIVLLIPSPNKEKTVEIFRKISEEIARIEGIVLRSYREPSQRDGFGILFFWLRALASSFKSEEDIYASVRAAVEKIVGSVHDFDEGMRKMERKRLDEVLNILQQYKIDTAFIRGFFYSLNGFERISTSAEDLARKILFAYRLLREFFRNGHAFDTMEGRSSVTVGVALPVGDERIEKIMEILASKSKSLVRLDDFGSTLIVAELKKPKRETHEIDEIVNKIKSLMHVEV